MLQTGTKSSYVVLESLEQNAKPPAGMYWIPSISALRRRTLSEDRRAAVESALQEIASYMAEPGKGPFGRPGWIRELFEWTESQILPIGLRVTGSFRQLNASPSFSLMRIETTGPALWLKATGDPNRRELAITGGLARLFPRYMPRLVATRSDWNAWLFWEEPGTGIESHGEAAVWERAARSLAEFQISSIGRTDELLKFGCRDFRAGQLRLKINPLRAAMRDYMQAQEKQSPPPLTSSELDKLGNSLTEACAALEELNVPSTIGHLDLNPGNILVSPERCVFLDWAEACVATPFITFAYLLEHFRRRRESRPDAEDKLVAAYLAPWQALFPNPDLARGMILSRLLAAFAYASRCQAAHPASGRDAAADAGYLRSLARRMYREALALEEKTEPCLS